jgi:DNA-binding protein YbaB
MSETADILLRRIEAIDTAAADNRLRAESYERMAAGLKDVHGTATSDDGVVTVVAGSDGAVKSITFGPTVRTTDPAALSSTTLRTVALARADAARKQAEVVRASLGDTDLLDRVLAEGQRTFGDEPPASAPTAPTAPPVRRPVVAEEPEEQDSGFKSRSAW